MIKRDPHWPKRDQMPNNKIKHVELPGRPLPMKILQKIQRKKCRLEGRSATRQGKFESTDWGSASYRKDPQDSPIANMSKRF